ncbi:MAG: glucokinase [Gammaproteobacteria bacterium]|nr:glucokinase [Gammaproteobacteria bacterium]
MHIIAADVGGTKTRLVYADAKEPRNVLYEARYLSNEFDSFEPMLQAFINESGSADTNVGALTLALPGLVSDSSARLTNLPWVIEKQKLKDTFGIKEVYFMNDFQASAFGTGQLLENDMIILNPGALNSDGLQKNGTRVAVGAGTGLGVAWADDDIQGGKRAVCTHDTEGGHIDFAPIGDTQIELLKFLQQRFEHVSYERILSGNGLVSLYEFCAGKTGTADYSDEITAEWVNNQSKNDEAADRALSLFVQIYGAYIGNIALLFKPDGGIFITGGIAAKILNKMQSEEFIKAYLNKGRMRALVEQIAVYLVTNDRVGVLGALSEAIKLQHQSVQSSSQHASI